ncbi:multidrug resistance protein B, putative [Talaromyces marneffei ATCC 18224]|uniref:Multidrug resistance protein B, putative n=1 Tax=Talaromyces marneffei (strain ATCC 18224 / CBS 334.59 / QM 7333) TaxID=441960 RepID=B6QFK3_TALMQ|nr:multidrug resistance protein B, putative [Talaromyces marneffei ATCC 18224]
MASAPDAATERHPLSDDSNGSSYQNKTSNETSKKGEEQTTPESSDHQPETRAVTGWRWILVCFGLYCAIFLYGLDNTIAADIQSAVLDTYGEVGQLAWIGTGFPLGSVATILLFGKAYGMFDVKWVHLGSIVVFCVGSAVCGAAPNMNALIVGRVIAGVGGAGLYLGMLNLIAINTLENERPAYMGGTGVIWGAGTILGPVIGGAFADSSATWRWAFYINLVIFGVLSPGLLSIPSFNPQPNVSTLTKLKELDWVGVTLIAGLYSSFVIALTFGGVSWEWSDGRTIATLVVCGVILLLFMAQQYFAILTTPERRLFPIQFITSRTMVILHMCTACGSTAITTVAIYNRTQRFHYGIWSILGIPGILHRPLPHWWSIPTRRASLMYTVKAGTTVGAIYGFSVLIAIGAGLIAQIGYSVAPSKVPPQDMAASIGFINVAQIGGLVIALAISGTVFQNVTINHLSKLLTPLGFSMDQIKGAVAGSQSTLFNSLSSDVRGQAIELIVDSISHIYALVIAAGALCFLMGALLKRERLFGATAVAAA